MTPRPYVSRRRRRCAAAICAHGGIEPGSVVVRVAPHRYRHAHDCDVSSLARRISEVVEAALPPFLSVVSRIGEALAGVGEAFANFATDVAAWRRRCILAAAVDLCWEHPVAVAAGDAIDEVIVVADAGEPNGGRLALDLASWALEDAGFLVTADPDRAAVVARWDSDLGIVPGADVYRPDAQVVTFDVEEVG